MEALIDGKPYPIATDRDGLAWRVADVGRPVEETWEDWSGGMGEAERKSKKGYYFSDGFDATTEGVLRLSPTIKSLVSAGLSTGHGYFFEVAGTTGTLTHDFAAEGSAKASATSVTKAHTVGTNSNRLMLVAVYSNATDYNPPTSVTYGGINLTLLTGAAWSNVGFWYLLSPPSGTANVVVTFAASQTIIAQVYSFYSANQTVPFGAAEGQEGTSTAPTATGYGLVGV